jgi:putative two-component system response regulator
MNQINDHIPPLAAPVGCILVVDDDKKSQRLFLDLLKAQGYSVTLADDGEQALEKAFANPPDVILLDIMMPNMDGYEVCRNLRLDPILAEVAIIMVTSLDDRAARLRGLEAGADDFITKPVDIIELLTRVRNVIQLNRYRKLLQERTKAQRAQAEIMSSCEATLAAWVRILERDGRVVLGQCDGVTQWALRLAKSAGMTNGDLGAVRWSILLHAIGAMAVPTALRGREDLSPEEEEQVHEQEAWIIEALAPVTALREALGIVARRHEHWDGSGRPDGLKGEAIPLAARVLAVALAWETNQTHAFSTTAARLAVLKAQAGHRFDPRLVEALERTVGHHGCAGAVRGGPGANSGDPHAHCDLPLRDRVAGDRGEPEPTRAGGVAGSSIRSAWILDTGQVPDQCHPSPALHGEPGAGRSSRPGCIGDWRRRFGRDRIAHAQSGKANGKTGAHD